MAGAFRFHLAADTLAFGCNLPTIRAVWGLAPVRIRSCWANKKGPAQKGRAQFVMLRRYPTSSEKLWKKNSADNRP